MKKTTCPVLANNHQQPISAELSQQQTLFRNAMASCASGVHVITTDGEAGRYGITMTAVTSITDNPPTIMLCVNRQTRIYPILQKNGLLCINVLSANQRDVAEHFAGMTPLTPEERFEQHIWHRGKTGQLQVDGALAHLHGKIVLLHEVGTHGVFYVEIDEILVHQNHSNNQTNQINQDSNQDAALVYFRRQFGALS